MVMGLLGGIFSRSKLPVVLRIFFVQVIAKMVRLVVVAISLYIANGAVSMGLLFNGVLTSIPGVVLQLVLLTILIVRKEKKNA